MSNIQAESKSAPEALYAASVEMKFELVVIPVSDVDRAMRFYGDLGWRLDIDFQGDEYRVVQFTPPGSGSSVMFGRNITDAAPGSAKGLHLIVADIEKAHQDLVRRGIEVGDPFHDVGGIFHHADGKGIVRGPNQQRKSYASYAAFNDPDGNSWVLQEVTARLPGKRGDDSFTTELAVAVWGEKQ